jgi:hypothetical protein
MLDHRFLQQVYQQWSDGQSDVSSRAADFVELAHRLTSAPKDQLMRELQKCSWFKRREN